MEMVIRGIILERKHLFNQWYIYLWDISGMYKKLWLR